MTAVSLIYAYWPNQPSGATWCDLPWALRDAGLPRQLTDAGHTVLESIVMSESLTPDDLVVGFELAAQIATDVAKARSENELAVILCGSCTLAAIGGVAGLGTGKQTGIVWCDAHPDLNTPETTRSGLLEGMALATATGHAWRTMARHHAGLTPANLANTVLVGARDIDAAEQELIDRHHVPITTDTATLRERLAHTTETYLHIDMDVHRDLATRTTSEPIAGGLTPDTLRALIAHIPNPSAVAITGLDPAARDAGAATRIAIDHILALASARSQA